MTMYMRVIVCVGACWWTYACTALYSVVCSVNVLLSLIMESFNVIVCCCACVCMCVVDFSFCDFIYFVICLLLYSFDTICFNVVVKR